MENMKTKFVLACLMISANLAVAETSPVPSANPQSISSIFSADGAAEPLAASSTSYQYIIAHWPYGQGFSTQAMLANSGTATATVKVEFFNQAGASFSVPLSGIGLESSETLTIDAGDVSVLATETSQRENSNLEVAWGIATSTAPLNVFSLFDLGSSSTSITGAVGAQSTVAAKTFRFPVSVGGPAKFTAGMAIANPNNSTADVTVMVLNADGSSMGSFQETLAGDNQTIFTLDSKLNFSSFSSAPFIGSVAVCATQPIGLVTVGFEGGAFFSTSVTNDPCPQ
jgi:hypothetical protein